MYVRTNGEESLELGVNFLEVVDSFVEADLPVLGLVVAFEGRELPLLHPAEGEDDVGTEVSWDVLGKELSNLRSVL
jgi:hypothetical protein